MQIYTELLSLIWYNKYQENIYVSFAICYWDIRYYSVGQETCMRNNQWFSILFHNFLFIDFYFPIFYLPISVRQYLVPDYLNPDFLFSDFIFLPSNFCMSWTLVFHLISNRVLSVLKGFFYFNHMIPGILHKYIHRNQWLWYEIYSE